MESKGAQVINHMAASWVSKESGSKESGFGLPPEGASMVLPIFPESAGVTQLRIWECGMWIEEFKLGF